MILTHNEPLNLRSTLLSGQAFRWREEEGWFKGIISGNVIWVREGKHGIEFSGGPDNSDTLVKLLSNYFSFHTNIESIYQDLSFDIRISKAINKHRGMRLLRQDPWECLVSFICSSASNIPRITKNIESICQAFGQGIEINGELRHKFPTPTKLAQCHPSEFRELGLGYRAEYLSSTARMISSGQVNLISLRNSSYEEALNILTTLTGVGDKVANCVLLFSLDKPEAFPVDTWIYKAIQKWYMPSKPKIPRTKLRPWAMDYFGKNAGWANHYLFHDLRTSNYKTSK